MTRNKGVDIFRTIALLLVLIYHAWTVCGMPTIDSRIIKLLVGFGGEIGVTAFFCLSGFGIYHSLASMEQKGQLTFQNHMKKRWLRVAPQYYLNLMVLVLFGGSVVYLSKDGIWNILSHIFFVHNISVEYNGSMSGVLWTMAVIFQFYLLAIVLYKMMKKHPYLFWVASVIFTIGMKFAALRWAGAVYGGVESWVFYVGRQLPTALDNFTIGMLVAYLVSRYKTNDKPRWIGPLLIAIGTSAMLLVCQYGKISGVHRVGISGYLFHSMLAVTIGVILYGFSQIQLCENNIVTKVLLWISDVEYGVYLWHLVLFQNFISGSAWITGLLMEKRFIWAIVIMVILAILVGAVFTKLTDAWMEKTVRDKK